MGIFGSDIAKKILPQSWTEEPGRALAAEKTESKKKQDAHNIFNTKKPGYDLSPVEAQRRQSAQKTWDPNTSIAPKGNVITRENRDPQGSGVIGGVERFDPKKKTIGNLPDGTVGLFQNGKKLDPGSVRLSGGNLGGTPLPAGQPTSFVKNPVAQQMVSNLQTPKPQTGISGVTQAPDAIPGAMPGGNWTGLMNQETAMLNSVVNPKLKPGQFQDFRQTIGMNPNVPGGDTGFREIESQIAALTRQNNQLLGGYGQTTEMARIPLGRRNAMVEENTKQIAALSQSLTGRSALANDLVKALIGAQSGAQVAGIGAQADITKAGITGDATVKAAQYDAMGDTATANAKLNQDADYKNNKIKLDSYKAIQQDLRKQLDANPGDVATQTKLDKINAAIEMLSSNGDDFLEQFIQKS